ncbi:trypsin-like serine protease, partial [Xanthomonas citri pv. citri]|nr:trypsin-like serine protease [Xanthomonas citri pv. citri]
MFKRGRNKIVGGTAVSPGDIPFQISFQDTSFGLNFHFCGGSVYTEEWMITAGHCVAGENFNSPVNLRIVAGDNDLSTEEGTEQAVAVIRIIQHEDYDSGTTANDVALLQIESALNFDNFVQGVALPAQLQDFTGEADVSGWGTLTEGGDTPDVLQVVTVPIVSDADC